MSSCDLSHAEICRHDASRNRARARRWAVLAVSVLWLAASGARLLAHELGTTRVVASFADGQSIVDISGDAATLLARLEALDRRPRSGPLASPEYPKRIALLGNELAKHARLTFDTGAAEPHVECVEEPSRGGSPAEYAGAPRVIIRLRGPIPPGARTFTWRYDLTSASYALTAKAAGGRQDTTVWLEGGQESGPLTLDRGGATSRIRIAATYFALGFTHIVPQGLDHILFVLGIFLFSRRLRPMLWQVSAFTLAHSITLGLTLYDIVSVRAAIVEPMIALSIVYVGVENLASSELKPWRVALVFAFGLLHGMGFAGVLRDLGLPRSEFLTGLLTFNAGVEAGQLTVIAGASLLVAYWAGNAGTYRRHIVVPGSSLIALTGLYWTIARLPVW
jgi:hydrogenase/urease accessory protein HupE